MITTENTSVQSVLFHWGSWQFSLFLKHLLKFSLLTKRRLQCFLSALTAKKCDTISRPFEFTVACLDIKEKSDVFQGRILSFKNSR